MAIAYFVCAVFVVVLAFYIYFTRTFDYWKHHNVSFEPPTVFFGNMTFALHESMSDYLRKLYKKFEGHDCFGIWMFTTPVLVVRTPKMAKEILVTKFNFFIDRAMETHQSDTLGRKCLPFAKGEHWTRLRHRLSPAFTGAKIRSILTKRTPAISKELHEYIDKQYGDKPIDVKKIFLTYSVEIIAGTIFGVRADSMQDKNSQLLKLGMSFVNWTPFRGLELSSILLFPRLVKLFKFKFFTKENTASMRSLLFKVIESRETDERDLTAQSPDVVDALIQLKDSGSDFSEDDILAQLGIFFFAGFETTSSILGLLTYELAFNQDIQENLYQQLKTIREEKTEVHLDDLEYLKLLDLCVKETLRKYELIAFSDRMCHEDCELSNGVVVKKGTRVAVCTSGLHHDENYFPEPERWNPYRFENDIVPFSYIPFGEGPRHCIGAKFGMLSIKMTMSSLIEQYRFEPCAETFLPKDLRLSRVTLVNTPDPPIMLKFIRR